MSAKIITAMSAAILLASAGLAFAEDQAPRPHKEQPRYYNMVPNQMPYDPAPYAGWDGRANVNGVTGQGAGR
jgi:hypothetical protein